jgi:hypothetical protein
MVYHVGDIVRIVEPLVVVRVGYPLTKIEALDAAEKEYSLKIYDFIANITGQANEFVITETDPRLYHDLVDALASYWLRLKGYGGKERKIYTEVNEELRDTGGWRVFNKRTVKTGTYNAGGAYFGGYDSEPDYEPPHLANEKCHVLLTLERGDGLRHESVEIESVNVEKEEDVIRGVRMADYAGKDSATQ